MKIEGVIFDMDGTLIDSEERYDQLYNLEFRARGLALDEERRAVLTGLDARASARKMRSLYPEERRAEQELTCWFASMVRQAALADPPIPPIGGVARWLELFRGAGLKLAVATSTEADPALLVLERAGLAGFFDAVVTGERVTLGKPAPDIYQMAAAELGLTPSRCFAVEDSINGLRAAAAAGMDRLAFSGTNRRGFDLAAYAPRVVDHYDEATAKTLIKEWGYC